MVAQYSSPNILPTSSRKSQWGTAACQGAGDTKSKMLLQLPRLLALSLMYINGSMFLESGFLLIYSYWVRKVVQGIKVLALHVAVA